MQNAKPSLNLNPIEKNNGVAMKLRRFLESELAYERELNDGFALDANQTALIRGKIFLAKQLLESLKIGPESGPVETEDGNAL